MDNEQVLNLFDSFWFEREIFNNHPLSPYPQNLQSENPLKSSPSPPPPPPPSEEEFFVPRIRTRSVSEDLSTKLSFMSDSNSPNSVLFLPKLQTIHSSKEIAELESPEIPQREFVRRRKTESRNRKRGPESKSLSELEFEELKGFIDLGFVFSEEDKKSSLASIVPGLNRLGKKTEEEETEEISRPYLSEAWEAMEMKKAPLMMNWRFPANENDMKDNLKWWAHAVASTVR